MPRGDGTGPNGMGPMTGRAAGYCAGYGVPGYMNSVGGRGFFGFGRGRGGGGRGFGWRNQFYATGMPGWQRASMGMQAYGRAPYNPAPAAAPTVSPEKAREYELDALKCEAEYCEETLNNIRSRIEQLEAAKK